jgi:hypothetical protein
MTLQRFMKASKLVNYQQFGSLMVVNGGNLNFFSATSAASGGETTFLTVKNNGLQEFEVFERVFAFLKIKILSRRELIISEDRNTFKP